MKKLRFFHQKHQGSLGILIAVVVLGFLTILVFIYASAFVGDRKGAGDTGEMIYDDGSGGGDGDSGVIPPQACSNVIESARKYLGQGIGYGHCGCGAAHPTGPAGVTSRCIDCSGFTTRVYRDAGHLPPSTCYETIGTATSNKLVLVSKNVDEARDIIKPGDIILINLIYENGTLKKYQFSNACIAKYGRASLCPSAHAMIYGGRSGSGYSIYESGGTGGGPHNKTNYKDFFGLPNRWIFFGVYRAKSCGTTTTNLENGDQIIDNIIAEG